MFSSLIVFFAATYKCKLMTQSAEFVTENIFRGGYLMWGTVIVTNVPGGLSWINMKCTEGRKRADEVINTKKIYHDRGKAHQEQNRVMSLS